MPMPVKIRKRHVPTVQLTERDTAILEAVYRYRMLTREQVERLLFPSESTDTRAKIRLQRLHQHGLLKRIRQTMYPGRPNPGAVYRLATLGAQHLAERWGIASSELRYWGRGDDRDHHATTVGPSFLAHSLTLVDLRLALEHAVTAAGLTIETWRDEAELRHGPEHDVVFADVSPGQRSRIPIIPDGYFVLVTPQGRGHFFLEADLGTESISDRWRRKIVGYKAYFTDGAFHKRHGVADRATGFRVLVTTRSPERAQHLKAAAERYGDASLSQLLLFTPFSDAMAQNPLTAPIWHRGGLQGLQRLL